MKTLTLKDKKNIAKLAVENQNVIENGTINFYRFGDGFSFTLNSMEFRYSNYEFIVSLKIWNESKPYSQAAFLRQIENAI